MIMDLAKYDPEDSLADEVRSGLSPERSGF